MEQLAVVRKKGMLRGKVKKELARREGRNDSQIAKDLGTDQSTVSRYRRQIEGPMLKQVMMWRREIDDTALPMGHQYTVIHVDPPWDVPDVVNKLCTLSLPKIAAPNCALWIWFQSVCDVARVIQAWDFQERAIYTWIKSNRRKVKMVVPNDAEHCLLATRGDAFVRDAVPTAFLGHVRNIGDKPLEFYDLVETNTPATRFADVLPGGLPRSGQWERAG